MEKTARNNEEPVLVIMAAGMGSRYGGLKQIDPVDEQGHIIMDYSLYDARMAGFKKVIFIIKEENQEVFHQQVGSRVEKNMEVVYVHQKLTDLPEGYAVPEGRVKPWGTAHAVLSARKVLDGPFAVINADDYYGRTAFSLIYDYLSSHHDDDRYHYAMVGYILRNTVTENGHVARGVCGVDQQGFLKTITERTMIEKTESGTAYSEDGGTSWTEISPDSLVSMNMWGFSHSFMPELERRFSAFLDANLPVNPVKCEYFLPFVVDELLKEGLADVQVLATPDKWYGMTYREDKQTVTEAMKEFTRAGVYPEVF